MTQNTTLLTEPQSEFFVSDSKYTCAVAGFGSGKTHCSTTRLITTKLKYPEINLAYLAPTLGLIKDIFYPRVEDYLDQQGIYYDINKSNNVINIQGAGKIFCRSMSRPESIIGWEVGDAFIDEFDILAKDKAMEVLRKITARCRQKFPDGKKNQLFFTTTPEGFKATYQIFKKEPLPDSRLIQMSTESNSINLPDDYIQGLYDQYPPELVDAYIEGKFVNLTSGGVYPYYNRGRHLSKRTVHKGEPLHIGMDFNVEKMCAVVFPQTRTINGKPQLRAIDELTRYFDTPAIIQAIKERYPTNSIIVYPDAAGKSRSTVGATLSDHKLLRLAGFKLRALNSNPFVKDRIQSVNRLFEFDQLKVNPETCPELVESLELQVYDKNGAPDKSSGYDHGLDAFGYRICKDHLISKPEIDYNSMVA